MLNFKSDETKNALNSWLCIEPNFHYEDDMRFYKFVTTYYEMKENISEEDFVAFAESIHPTTDTHHTGMYQQYYNKLTIIVAYLKSTK